MFNDNFDKENLKDGFINWLWESEIIEDRVRMYEVKKQGSYFGRISDPRLYKQISQDILARKVYPIVIDKKAIDLKANYKFKMSNIYIDQSAQISMSARVYNNSVIGQKT